MTYLDISDLSTLADWAKDIVGSCAVYILPMEELKGFQCTGECKTCRMDWPNFQPATKA